MKNFEKILYSLVVSTVAFSASFANAADAKNDKETAAPTPKLASELANKTEAILFKIHDIKPVKNAEDVVTSCEYTATFYNRSYHNLRQARLDFGWTDSISETFLNDEQTENTEKAEPEVVTKTSSKQPTKPEEKALGTILSGIDLPALGSLKQVSLRGSVETDKCFLLLDNLQFKVSSCNLLDQEQQDTTRRGRYDSSKELLNCASLFTYVNSKHPEYYGEFKEISYDQQQKDEKKVETKEIDAIKKVNDTIGENIEKTNTIISNIQ